MEIKSQKIKYEFTAKAWQHAGPGTWHFISLPKSLSKKIRSALRSEEEGWGRLKAIAEIGNSEWTTAIWYATKRNTYVLPLKVEIRKKEGIEIGTEVKAALWI